MTLAKKTNKYNPGLMIGHSGRQIDIKMKFLIAQLILKKQIKILVLFAQSAFLKNNKMAIIAKKLCGLI